LWLRVADGCEQIDFAVTLLGGGASVEIVAGSFDGPIGLIAAKIMARANREAEAEAIAELAPASDDDVLVVGFGPGVGLWLLSRIITNGHIAGVDSSRVMLREARRRNRVAVDSGRIELRRGTADALPWPEESFDAVATVNTIQLWRPFPACVGEVARVLRPGGRLVSFTHDWAIRRSTGMDIEDWARHAAVTFREHGLTEARWWRGKSESGKSVAFSARRDPEDAA
jgi:SAM-dependent methyltransferase